MKAVTANVQSEFHVFTRAHLGGRVVVQDLDAWAVAISDAGTHKCTALIEVKRSHYLPEIWRPWPEDRNNYAALLSLANDAGVPLYVLYHVKGKPIADDDLFHVFHLTAAVPEYHGRRRLIRADEFARVFPHVFNGGPA